MQIVNDLSVSQNIIPLYLYNVSVGYINNELLYMAFWLIFSKSLAILIMIYFFEKFLEIFFVGIFTNIFDIAISLVKLDFFASFL